VHSTAQPSFQARACFGDPSSLLPIQRIQTLWHGSLPLKMAWQHRRWRTIPIIEPSRSFAAVVEGFAPQNFLDVLNNELKHSAGIAGNTGSNGCILRQERSFATRRCRLLGTHHPRQETGALGKGSKNLDNNDSERTTIKASPFHHRWGFFVAATIEFGLVP